MLRDGKYIKEPAPIVSQYWTKVERPVKNRKLITAEEIFIEAINLNIYSSDMPKWKILLAKLLRI